MTSFKEQRKTVGQSATDQNRLTLPGANRYNATTKDGGATFVINPEVENGEPLLTRVTSDDGEQSVDDSDFTGWVFITTGWQFSGPKGMSYVSPIKDDPEAVSAFDAFAANLHTFIDKNPTRCPQEWRQWIVGTTKGSVLTKKPKLLAFVQCSIIRNGLKKPEEKYGEKAVIIGGPAWFKALEALANSRDEDGVLLYPNLVGAEIGCWITTGQNPDPVDKFDAYAAVVEKENVKRNKAKVSKLWSPWEEIINFMTVEQQIATLRANWGQAALACAFQNDAGFRDYLTEKDKEAWTSLQKKERARLKAELEAEEAVEAVEQEDEPVIQPKKVGTATVKINRPPTKPVVIVDQEFEEASEELPEEITIDEEALDDVPSEGEELPDEMSVEEVEDEVVEEEPAPAPRPKAPPAATTRTPANPNPLMRKPTVPTPPAAKPKAPPVVNRPAVAKAKPAHVEEVDEETAQLMETSKILQAAKAKRKP